MVQSNMDQIPWQKTSWNPQPFLLSIADMLSYSIANLLSDIDILHHLSRHLSNSHHTPNIRSKNKKYNDHEVYCSETFLHKPYFH